MSASVVQLGAHHGTAAKRLGASLERSVLSVADAAELQDFMRRNEWASALIICRVDDIRAPIVEALLLSAVQNGVRLGFAPYVELPALDAWVDRRLAGVAPAQSDMLVVSARPVHEMPHAVVLREDDLDANSGTLGSRDWNVALLEYHSKETCGRLGALTLCGAPYGETPRSNLARPGCASGRRCLWGEGPRLRMRDLNVRHTTALACGSLRLGSRLADAHFNLGLSAFSGGKAQSYLAPFRFVFTDTLFMSFAAAVHEPGQKLGDIANRLNGYLLERRLDYPCFALLGDPEQSLPPNHSQNEQSSRIDPQPTLVRPAPRATTLARRHAAPEQRLRDWVVGELPDNEAAMLDTCEALARADSLSSYWLSTSFLDAIERHNVKGAIVCPGCGDHGLSYDRIVKGTNAKRRLDLCSTCGIISDRPANAPMYRFDADPCVRRGDPIGFALDVGGAMRGFFSFSHAVSFGWKAWPKPCPAERQHQREIMPANFPEGVYHLRWFGIENDQPSFLSRPVEVS